MRIIHDSLHGVPSHTSEPQPSFDNRSSQSLENHSKLKLPLPTCPTPVDDGLCDLIPLDESKSDGDGYSSFSTEPSSGHLQSLSHTRENTEDPEDPEDERIRGWATVQQRDWLAKKRADYLAAHADDALVNFYDKVTEEWLEQGWTWEEVGATRLPKKSGKTEEQYQKDLKVRAKKVSKPITSVMIIGLTFLFEGYCELVQKQEQAPHP